MAHADSFTRASSVQMLPPSHPRAFSHALPRRSAWLSTAELGTDVCRACRRSLSRWSTATLPLLRCSSRTGLPWTMRTKASSRGCLHHPPRSLLPWGSQQHPARLHKGVVWILWAVSHTLRQLLHAALYSTRTQGDAARRMPAPFSLPPSSQCSPLQRPAAPVFQMGAPR